jgi:hypothetical protein
MDSLRKIFHKAVHTPLHNIEQIWKEYDAYENGLSKLTVFTSLTKAKKLISDRAAGYMTARAAMKDFKSLLDPIEKLTNVWYASPPSWSASEVALVYTPHLSWGIGNGTLRGRNRTHLHLKRSSDWLHGLCTLTSLHCCSCITFRRCGICN